MTRILQRKDLPARSSPPPCLAFYSSWFGGIVTDPELMVVPVDDHLVHRGDGVFETIKAVDGRMWLVDAHLRRLQTSASTLGIELPVPISEIEQILSDTLAAATTDSALLRILVSRGPGSFSVNPYDASAPQLYVAVYPASIPFMEKHPGGGHAICSQVPVKPGLLARVKTCNYIPNALMKKEAVDAGVHFVFGVDEDGHIAESFTENVCLVAKSTLVRPLADNILAGTTMARVFELAEADGVATATRPFTPDALKAADEILIMGTTAEVTAVTRFEDKEFTRGPMFERLSTLLRADLYGS